MRKDAQVSRWVWRLLPLALLACSAIAQAQSGTSPTTPTAPSAGSSASSPGAGKEGEGWRISQLPDLSKRENISAALQIVILLTVLSLAPAILIMMTSFTRIVIVLSLLRQAIGTPSLPPNQVLVALSLFMTFLVMGPTFQAVNRDALRPYLDGRMAPEEALTAAQIPLRQFMIGQIERGGNQEDVRLFTDFAKQPPPKTYADVSTMTLIPAFMLGELKTAFLLGFKVYLPFLIIDMVISAILISMGMMMLPPVLISLPFKLLLFVLVDGWRLITGSLMGSFIG
ncbi:MAG: flagellar type III secretion system pore protein FliP [Planctomycetota bacterium]|nr:flagellar type III secretion system pore protein FliP [Planctomycetota bacterium]